MRIQVPLSPWVDNASPECDEMMIATKAKLKENDTNPLQKNPQKLHIHSEGLKSSIRRTPLSDVGINIVKEITPLRPGNAIAYSEVLPTFTDEKVVHELLPPGVRRRSPTPSRCNVASHPIAPDAPGLEGEEEEHHSKSHHNVLRAPDRYADEARLEALLKNQEQSSRENIEELRRELAAKDRTCALLQRQNHWLRQTAQNLADERAADSHFAAEELAVLHEACSGRPSMGDCGTCLEFQRLYDEAVTRRAETDAQAERLAASNTAFFRQINYVNTVLKSHRAMLEASKVPAVARLARELSVWCENNRNGECLP
jgi:hypothetical protein